MLFQEQMYHEVWVLRRLFLIYLGSYFQCLELIMLVSRTKLMPSGGKGSNLG